MHSSMCEVRRGGFGACNVPSRMQVYLFQRACLSLSRAAVGVRRACCHSSCSSRCCCCRCCRAICRRPCVFVCMLRLSRRATSCAACVCVCVFVCVLRVVDARTPSHAHSAHSAHLPLIPLASSNTGVMYTTCSQRATTLCGGGLQSARAAPPSPPPPRRFVWARCVVSRAPFLLFACCVLVAFFGCAQRAQREPTLLLAPWVWLMWLLHGRLSLAVGLAHTASVCCQQQQCNGQRMHTTSALLWFACVVCAAVMTTASGYRHTSHKQTQPWNPTAAHTGSHSWMC
jgi:hypothetical protein